MSEEVINIVICYNNASEVMEYYSEILSLDEGKNIGYVVVINSSSEDEQRQLEQFGKDNEHVYVFNPGKNLGYMNGLLLGYRGYRDLTGNLPKYIIMSNTDIAFEDKAFAAKLLSRNYDSNVAIIGPSILVSELNSYDNPVSDDRYTIKQLNKVIMIHNTPAIREFYVTASFLKPKFIKRKKDFTSRNVYELHGCFFILTSEYAELLKTLNFGVLLYSEETFVAENAYRNGLKAFYDAELEVVHKEHSTTGKLKPTRRAKLIAESMTWIRDTYFVDNKI